MSTAVLTDRTGIGVHQRRKFFELRNQYSLTDEQGEAIGAVEQVSQSAFTFLTRLFSDLDVVLPVTLAVVDCEGREVLRLRKRWFRYAVTVTDGEGATVGQVIKRIRFGKAMFSVISPDGSALGVLRAENWRARDFRFEDTAAVEAARVTKHWRGLLTEVITDADSYAVTFAPSTDGRVRLLAFASALAVDLTMKQKDYGFPLDF